MTDTTKPLPKTPKPDEGSGVCLTPENPDRPDAKGAPEQAPAKSPETPK